MTTLRGILGMDEPSDGADIGLDAQRRHARINDLSRLSLQASQSGQKYEALRKAKPARISMDIYHSGAVIHVDIDDDRTTGEIQQVVAKGLALEIKDLQAKLDAMLEALK